MTARANVPLLAGRKAAEAPEAGVPRRRCRPARSHVQVTGRIAMTRPATDRGRVVGGVRAEVIGGNGPGPRTGGGGQRGARKTLGREPCVTGEARAGEREVGARRVRVQLER